MTVCVDTNVLLPVLGLQHRFGVILDAWISGRFTWAVSTETMLEYEEIIAPRIGQRRWQEFVALQESAGTFLGNIRRISSTYRFRLITGCPDDDKFADCAIAADADFIITEDAHFNALIGSGYKPQPITPEEFIARHLTPAS